MTLERYLRHQRAYEVGLFALLFLNNNLHVVHHMHHNQVQWHKRYFV